MNKISCKKIFGFSLIEALIASLIAAVGLLGFAQLQTITLLNSSDSRLRTDALNLAQEQIETLRDFSNQSGYDGLANGTTANIDGQGATFTRTWTVTDCIADAGCNEDIESKVVNVTVSWQDAKGDAQSVQLTSYIATADPVKGGMSLL